MKEKFIVIGSNSFSGSNFIEYVLTKEKEALVWGVSRSPENPEYFLPYKSVAGMRFKFYQLDLNKDLDQIITLVREVKPEYIINFAAQGMVGQSWQAPEQWFQTNCLAMTHLAKALSEEKYIKRYVHISSPEVYGSCDNVTEETAKYKPSTPYAASKVSGDMSLYPYYVNKGLPLVYTRATNVYGPYQQLYRIIPRTVISIKKGIKVPLHGAGKAIKSYIHIRDVCDATLKVCRGAKTGEVYHISPDDRGISIYGLVDLLCKMMGKKTEECLEVVSERPGQDSVYIIDSTKIRRELGWKPLIPLDKGLKEVVSWVNRYWDKLKDLPLEYIHKL